MNKKIAFILLVITQLAVPSWMIISQENILNQGTVYKFKTAPVDPYDIFRGRYVSLSTDQRSTTIANSQNIEKGQSIYVILETNHEGFAQVKTASISKPVYGDYIKTKITHKNGNKVYFRLPFDRYYMNEEKAPKAEALYRRNNMRSKQDAYILVRVLNGSALIEGLYVGGKDIEAYF